MYFSGHIFFMFIYFYNILLNTFSKSDIVITISVKIYRNKQKIKRESKRKDINLVVPSNRAGDSEVESRDAGRISCTLLYKVKVQNKTYHSNY